MELVYGAMKGMGEKCMGRIFGELNY